MPPKFVPDYVYPCEKFYHNVITKVPIKFEHVMFNWLFFSSLKQCAPRLYSDILQK